MKFKDAIEIANKIGIKEEKIGINKEIILILNDNSELHFESQYEEDLSEVTPGDGIQPPTVEHYKVKK